MEVVKLDERANTCKFSYSNKESDKYNLATTVMMDFYHVAIYNDDVRKRVTEQITQNGQHLVWSAKEKNIHYLARVA